MVSGRSLEAGTALVTGAFGAAVAISSLDNGIGWSAAGVDAGFFPFIIGLIILGGSIFNLVQGWLQARDIALRPKELKRLAALFVPAVIYVGVLLDWNVDTPGQLESRASRPAQAGPGLISAGLARRHFGMALYLIFELTFQVSCLTRGALQ